jgi:hypothetical protein
LIWRVAGATPDAVVVVPVPIASAQLVKQAVQTSGGRHPASSGEARSGSTCDDDYSHLRTDLRSPSRNLQITHELVSDIYVRFAISDFANLHSAFHRPFGDGRS